jgi:hypothetical protein
MDNGFSDSLDLKTHNTTLRVFKQILSGCLVLLICGGDWVRAAPIPPDVKDAVAFVLRAGDKPGELVPYGTAFFVGVPDPKNGGRSFVYLVTAKHVFQTPDHKWLPQVFVRLNTKEDSSELLQVPIVISGEKKTVFLDPDSTVDIAVVPADPKTLDEKKVDFKVIPLNMITTEDDFKSLKITEGSEVFFTGLFSPYLGTKKNYPVVRFGRVALITKEKIRFVDEDLDLYLVETGSYGGNSGSPVFFYLGAERGLGVINVGSPVIKLAGVMKGSFLDQQPIRSAESTSTPVSVANMGIAAVVPAYKLYGILLSEELKKQRGQ